MTDNKPDDQNVPDAISFVALLNELRRRRLAANALHPEREILFDELVDREHSLEQRILLQLEGTYSGKKSWWKRIFRIFVIRMNVFVSAFNPHALPDDSPSREHQV